MQINCLVIDDEPLARRLIESHIEKLSLFSEVTYAKNAIEALEILRADSFDLLLLDVQMPKLNGIDFLKSLSHPPKVILTTAFRDFAVDAFELDVIDYLVKPIAFERFVKAVNKFVERSKIDLKSHAMPAPFDEIINVRSDRKMVRIPVSDICYIESIKDYIKIYTPTKSIITKETISSIQIRLVNHQFLRIHRSYLVSIQKVRAFSHEFVEVLGKQLPYGRTFKESALTQLEST